MLPTKASVLPVAVFLLGCTYARAADGRDDVDGSLAELLDGLLDEMTRTNTSDMFPNSESQDELDVLDEELFNTEIGSPTWCYSSLSEVVGYDNKTAICAPHENRRHLASEQYRRHAIAVHGAHKQWMIAHHHLGGANSASGLKNPPSYLRGIEVLDGRQSCEKSEPERPWIRHSGSSANKGWGMYTYAFAKHDNIDTLVLHDIPNGALIAVTGVIQDDSGLMRGCEHTPRAQCKNQHWCYIRGATSGDRCGVIIKIKSDPVSNPNWNPLLDGTQVRDKNPCIDRDCARRSTDCNSNQCKPGTSPNCVERLGCVGAGCT